MVETGTVTPNALATFYRESLKANPQLHSPAVVFGTAPADEIRRDFLVWNAGVHACIGLPNFTNALRGPGTDMRLAPITRPIPETPIIEALNLVLDSFGVSRGTMAAAAH